MPKEDRDPKAEDLARIRRGSSFMRVVVNVVGEDGETTIRTEICDVFWEVTVTKTEAQLEEGGGLASVVEQLVKDRLAGLGQESPTLNVLTGRTAYPPKEGKTLSLEEARRQDLVTGRERGKERRPDLGPRPKMQVPKYEKTDPQSPK